MNSKAPLATTVFFLLFFFNQNYAQVEVTSKRYLQTQMQHRSLTDLNLNADNYFKREAAQMGLNSASEMEWIKTIAGENGTEHYKYQQVYQSIPVFGSAYTIHQKNGIATHASGYYLPMINLSIEPIIKPEMAIQLAKQEMSDKTFSRDNLRNEIKPKLVIIDRAFPQSSEHYALAYRIVISRLDPVDKRQYFIDAQTGSVLLDFPLIMHQGVPAQGKTKYYGTQSITVDSLSPNNFLLRDPTRNGNATYMANDEIWSSTTNSWNLTNEKQDEVALDAHYCTQVFHDFMLEKFNWNGLNNNGLPMNSIVHADDNVNAFWDGDFAFFGDGDCNHGPLTTLEVVAHEFMHGITENTSGLIYADESGAINESISDIFGKALEYFTTPDEFNWDLGSSIIETPYAESFRSFSDPNSREHPKYYRGEYWQDHADVHINSSIGNHWFYNLVKGGAGVNEDGEPYDITGIGMDKAIKIVFLTQRAYLTPNTNYQYFHESTLLASQELFGENAPEIISVKEAWKVVGLTDTDQLDLAVNFPIFFNNVCLNNEYYGAEVNITNIGTLPYFPSLNGEVSVFAPDGSESYVFQLTSILLPGETQVFAVNDLIFFDKDSTAVVTAILKDIDGYTVNNSAFGIVNNISEIKNDLKLLTPYISESNCFSDIYEVGFSIQNNACEILLAGTSFEVIVENPSNDFYWSYTHTLENELLSRRQSRFTKELNLPPSLDQYSVTLVFMDDNNLDNNQSIMPDEIRTPIAGIYSNPMDGIDPYLKKEELFISDYIGYNENSVLAITTSRQNRTYLCTDAADNLAEMIPGKSATLYFCADLANMENINLGFDLIQFRNMEGIDFPELENNTTILKTSWTSENDNFQQIISGQLEGESVHYDLALPTAFKGRVQFDFFHNVGDPTFEALFEHDISLLDNLTITGDSLYTIIEGSSFAIHPNPSSGLLSIKHPEPPMNVNVHNTNGQLVLSLDRADDLRQVDLSEFPDSYYFLTIEYESLGKITKPFVKIKP